GIAAAQLVPFLIHYGNVGGSILLSAILLTLGGMCLARSLRPVAHACMAGFRRAWVVLAKPMRHRRLAKRRASHPRGGDVLLPSATVVLDPAAETRSASYPQDPPSGTSEEPADGAPATAAPSPTGVAPPPLATPYAQPSLALLNSPTNGKRPGNGADLSKHATLLEGKLGDFGIDGRVVQVLAGPVVTMYEFEPASGIKVSRIVNLADDLALGMKALSVRIVAPVPGKAVVGIEIPNAHREPVFLRDVLASPAFQQAHSKLVLALGKDILGIPTVTDLAQIPHLLIAGATGSGKSVGLNSMICSILCNATPDDVKFIMIDPKMLELSVYDGIPHLIAPVVTHPKKAAAALHWAVEEMERRYRLLAERGVRGIEGHNQAHPTQRLPYIVVVIDELADLMLVSHREVEDALTRLAQMARASGIHLLVATQRPSVDVLTGIIKANFPARNSFQVSSRIDS
ncbi:MAG: DNA translocase FtsK, partial [Candidatus Entotheonellia bacterium]